MSSSVFAQFFLIRNLNIGLGSGSVTWGDETALIYYQPAKGGDSLRDSAHTHHTETRIPMPKKDNSREKLKKKQIRNGRKTRSTHN